MINHISIKNFAIIENADVDFEPGLNIVTGETGSGKSILIEAVSLALGSRADSSCIRTGCEKAVVQLLGELDGEEILISREVSASGKNLCRLNGELVTLTQLNQVCRKLADIHGQYDNQSLLDPDSHIALLDSYRSKESFPVKEQVSQLFHLFAAKKRELASLLSFEKENARKKDFYRFEMAEIDKAEPLPGEDDALADKISILQNSEKIYENIERTYTMLFEENPSVLDGLGVGLHALESIASYSKEIDALSQDFSDLYYRLQDIGRSLGSMREQTVFSPAELDAAIARMDTLDNLKKKYGDTIEEVLAYRDRIAAELDVIENFDDQKKQLEAEALDAKHQLEAACQVLTQIRQRTAAELAQKMEAELIGLNFTDAKVQIAFRPLSAPGENGADSVEILISTNKGEPLKPLAKTASGGEMSRIMLAIKNIISSYDRIPTLIFDEIDNGISGITASIVGQKLKEIAQSHQIICITHLPQIAACGKHNYRIFKQSDSEKTFTTVEALTEEEKVREIARLLGGSTITETTLQSARELIAGS